MRLLRISLESPSVMCEIQNQTNHITMLLISSFTSIYWEKLDYRKAKFLHRFGLAVSICFLEGYAMKEIIMIMIMINIKDLKTKKLI